MDGKPDRRNKAAFSHFSGPVWTGRQVSQVIKNVQSNQSAVVSIAVVN